jgi:hypothetical protein
MKIDDNWRLDPHSPELKRYVDIGLALYRPESNAEKQTLIYGLQNAFWVKEAEYKKSHPTLNKNYNHKKFGVR